MPNLLSLLHQSVKLAETSDALLYKQGGVYQNISYGELWQMVHSFAYGLQKLGLQPNDKVAILANNHPAWTIGDYAILLCGAVSVPIYPTQTAEQVGYLLQNADVTILLAENKTQAEKAQTSGYEGLHFMIVIDEAQDLDAEWLTFQKVLESGYELFLEKGPLTTWQQMDETALATIVHTSGTTGQPKGVMLTHQNLVANIEAIVKYAPIHPDDRTLSYLPLSHIFERTCGQYAVLSSGAAIAFAESIDKISDNLLEVRPTTMTSVPRLFEKIYDGVLKNIQASSNFKQTLFSFALKVGKEHLEHRTLKTRLLFPLLDRLVFQKIRARTGGRIRVLVSGGAALNPVINEFFHIIGLPICEGYGMTETAPVIATNPLTDVRIGTVGRPLENVQVKIAEDGEVLVKGPSVMVGYYKNPEATAEIKSADGWLRTGDIGELVGGYLRIVERKKNILVLATGKNVAPFPIESALSQSPYLSQAILLGDKRKYVTALLVPDFGALFEWLEKQGLVQPAHTPRQPHDITAWLSHPLVQALYEKEVSERLQGFAPYEKPKKFTLLPRELSLETGELTATLKVRMHVLQTQYQAEIEAMYAESKQAEA